MRYETAIVPVRANKADLKAMRAAVAAQTGDQNPFFCPEVKEGKPYEGHTHAFPPSGVVDPCIEPINLTK